MHLAADEKNIPRIHLIGSLVLALLLTVALTSYLSWQHLTSYRASLGRVEQSAKEQIMSRLQAEMASAINIIEFSRSRGEFMQRASMVEHVNLAYQTATAIYTHESARMPEAEIKKLIIETLRPLRFYENRGYYFINDMHGRFILLPSAAHLEGTQGIDKQDDQGNFIMRGLLAAIKKSGSDGFFRYRWYPPDGPKQMADKLSYARYFAPYNWLIGTGDYLYKWEEGQKTETLARLRSIRFGKRGYIAVTDQDNHLLVTPSNPEYEGGLVNDLPKTEQASIAYIQAAAKKGGGFISYDWTDPSSKKIVHKTALIQTYQPWGWTLIVTVFDDELQAAIGKELFQNEANNSQRLFDLLIAVAVALILSLLGSLAFSRWAGRLFRDYHQRMAAKEASLKRSEEHYQALADNGQALIWMAGLDKGCHYFNRPWLEFTGRSLEQESGNGWAAGVHPDDFQECLAIYNEAFDQREKFNMVYRLRRHDGQYRWILDEGTPRFDGNHEFIGYVGHCLDISDIKTAEDEIARHRLHLEQLVAERTAELQQANVKLSDTHFAMERVGIGIHWVNVNTGQFIYVNKFAADMLGYAQEEMLALTVPDIDPNFPKGDAGQQVRDHFRQLGHAKFESIQTAKDGRRIPVEIILYYSKSRHDTPERFITFVTDITQRKEAERALVKAKEAAETANIAKSAFLANMSHEIRTPLNAITGMAHLIRRSGVSEQQADRLDKIETAGQHLLEIINAVLDLSKIEAGKFTLEECDVNSDDIITNVVAIMSEQAQAKQLQLITNCQHCPAPLLGDAARIQQALLNYATNAIKFTESGSITISSNIEMESEHSVLLRFSVTDTGIGITPARLDNLFSAFEQADNSITRKYGGTGLGLAITRKLAELMGGAAGATSLPDHGSTFWFTVKLKKGRLPTHLELPPSSDMAEFILLQQYGDRRLLLVEDEAINREITLDLLQDAGLQADVAEDGLQAVALCQKNNYDVILMDMQMPRMDGLQATRQIRQSCNRQNPCIIAMTANAFAEDKARCFEAGMDDFITKPVDPELLFATILKWFLHRQQQQS